MINTIERDNERETSISAFCVAHSRRKRRQMQLPRRRFIHLLVQFEFLVVTTLEPPDLSFQQSSHLSLFDRFTGVVTVAAEAMVGVGNSQKLALLPVVT